MLRERRSGKLGSASALLEALAGEPLAVSAHAACELQAGAALSVNPDSERANVDALLSALVVVQTGESLPVRYGEVLAELKKRGQSIPTMDLLIATAALTHDATLVTSNARDLDRVPGLTVRGY